MTNLNRGKWFYDVVNDKFIEVGTNSLITDTHSYKVYIEPELFRLDKKTVEEIVHKHLPEHPDGQKFDYTPELIFVALQQGFVRITDVLDRAGNRTIEGVSEKDIRRCLIRMQEEGVQFYDITIAIRNGSNMNDGIVKRIDDLEIIERFIKGGMAKVGKIIKEVNISIPENILSEINSVFREKRILNYSFLSENKVVNEWLEKTFDKNVVYKINNSLTVYNDREWYLI